MFAKVKQGAPDAGSEADKWHQVSVQALVTSRKYMVEQQTSLIQRLANVTGTDLPVSGNIALASPKEDAPVPKEDAPVALPQGAIAPPPGLEIMNCDQQVGNPQSGSPASSQKFAERKISHAGEGNSLRTDLEKIKEYE